MSQTSYPLSWPIGQPRQPKPRKSRFACSLAAARDHLLAQVRATGGSQVIISSNAKARNDGLPYSKQGVITDAGVAVYFSRSGQPVCIACDQWETIAENIRAVGLAIEAMRSLERWGVSQVIERVFSGFTALPAGDPFSQVNFSQFRPEPDDWWTVLEVEPTANEGTIRAQYRKLLKVRHPDAGGSNEKFIELMTAYERAMASPGGPM